KNAGKATATITGKGNYKGSLNKTFTIKAKKITSFKIYNTTYNGKAQTPAIYYSKKVTDEYGQTKTTYVKYKKNTDYTISVSGKHKAIGQYTAKVKFKGNYTGTVSKTFQILPKPVKSVKTSPASTTEIKVSWSKVDNVSGYKIYRYNQKTGKFSLYKTTSSTSIKIKRASSDDIDVGFYVRTYKKVGKKTYYSDSSKNCYDYEYVKPSKPSFTIKKIDFGEFLVNFKKVNYYEVQVSVSKSFKNTVTNRVVTFRGCTNSVLAYNLNSGQRYYVRARAYYYDKKGNLKVGAWSDVKSVVSY
ncbi:MAG: hypothetical protein K2K42_04155, partial [Eubacterium sp.]|nr:hypothetical protein [Eubacterium sp.]